MRKLLLCLLAAAQSYACTGIKLAAADGSLVHGRTAEFGIDLELSLIYIPRGYEFTGTTANGPGLKYKTRFAALGACSFGNPLALDGLNEKGLSVGVFFFPRFATYTPLTAKNQAGALSPIDFSNWLLTQFETVDEIKASLRSIAVVPTILPGWGDEPPPFHYIVIDRQGRAIVIEPVQGKLIVHDNPLGVITNSPTFDWHMTNLTNYLSLTPFNVKPRKIDGLDFAPFGQGSGLIGLPGDFSPPSRFVRAALFSINAIPAPNGDQAVLQAFHILNQFDIPLGAIRAADGHTDKTLATVVRDPQALKYYIRTYDNQTIKVIHLKAFDPDAPQLKTLDLSGPQPLVDATKDFQD